MKVRSLLTGAAAAALAATPIAAEGLVRQSAPVDGEQALAGQGTLFFLAGMALIALAVVLLPEDQPASP
ncbi:hypothetical protein [Qipengyuania sediminis]|uniref:hypothetical protein n=1 Tax=Qipengyuania sediminis TaxID=1532023 RepID=UPI00105A36F2|nr:hypothetical protein [Qipengyuania sediminis]